MNDTPQTATEVALFLGGLSYELQTLVKGLGAADKVATHARSKYNKAYSQAFLRAEGAMEMRKHLALDGTADLRSAADEAECEVRRLKAEIDAIKVRIDVGRSYGAAVRSELEVLRGPFQEHP